MRKSDIIKEFNKQVRIIEKQLAQLQQQGITINPQDIERLTKRTKVSKTDIENLRLVSSELEQKITPSKRPTVEDKPKKFRRAKEEYVKKSRKKLDEETKRERRNYRARVRRLEKQGYDVSKLGKGRDYTLEELQNLKRGALSKQAYKGEESAYDIKKREAELKRKQTIALRERIKETYSQLPIQESMETLRPRELGDYVDVGRGALVNQYHDSSMIQTLIMKFASLENINKYPIEGRKQMLIEMFMEIVGEYESEDDDALLLYEDYLRSKESEIMNICDKIVYDSGRDDANFDFYFANLFSILNKGPLTAQQSRLLSEAEDYYDYT